MNIFGIGLFELVFILIIAFLVLGPAKMVDTARTLGKALRELQRATSEVPRLFSLEEEPKVEQLPPRQVVKEEEPPEEEQKDRPVPRA